MTTFYFWSNLFFFVLSQSFLVEASPDSNKTPFLLIGLQRFIGRMELDGGSFGVYMYENNEPVNVFDIDTDIRTGRIFWTDQRKNLLKQAYVNHDYMLITNMSNVQGNANGIERVAWDWVNSKLYWTTFGSDTVDSTIEVMDTDTGCRKVLARFDDGTKPGAIVLDPAKGWMFWSDTNRITSKIVRMSMDGTNSLILVDSDTVKFPTDLSLDYATQTLFWIDADLNEIGNVLTDGTQRRRVAKLEQYYNVPDPFALEYYRGELYYSNLRKDSIQKLTSLMSDKQVTIVKNFTEDPTTIHVIDEARQPMVSRNPCSKENCEYLCLLSSQGYRCILPDNFRTCKRTNIKRATTPKPFRPKTQRPKNPPTKLLPPPGGILDPEGGFRGSSVSGTRRLIGALLVAIAIMTFIIV